MAAELPAGAAETSPGIALPRVTIQFCTQCKWMLRAAYFAQELLSTFSTSLGEVALQPATGGVFRVELVASVGSSSESATPQHHVLWDRKTDGGFPETKELKRRVRNIIDPDRDLGHVDRDHSLQKMPGTEDSNNTPAGHAPSLPQVPHGIGAGAGRLGVPKPPADATAEMQARLDEAKRRKAAAAAAGEGSGTTGPGEAAAAAADGAGEANKGAEKKCEDCD